MTIVNWSGDKVYQEYQILKLGKIKVGKVVIKILKWVHWEFIIDKKICLYKIVIVAKILETLK